MTIRARAMSWPAPATTSRSCRPAALYERKPAFVVVFAWRYVDPIRAKHARYFADGGKFVVPLPTVTFIDRAD